MLLKKSASLLTIVAMAMSVGSATAANLLVDDFSQLGSLPSPATTNVWNVGGLTNVHGGTREQNKAGTGTTYSNAGGHLRMSTTGTGTGASWDIIYDGVLGANPLLSPAFTSFPNPSPGPINASGMTYLNVLMPQVAKGGTGTSTTNRPAIIATIKWSNTPTGSVITSTRELKLTDYANGGYSFKLSEFTAAVGNPANIRGIKIRLQGLVRNSATSPGVTEFDRLFFATSPLPEPGTFALAAMGLVGLVVARRKMR